MDRGDGKSRDVDAGHVSKRRVAKQGRIGEAVEGERLHATVGQLDAHMVGVGRLGFDDTHSAPGAMRASAASSVRRAEARSGTATKARNAKQRRRRDMGGDVG